VLLFGVLPLREHGASGSQGHRQTYAALSEPLCQMGCGATQSNEKEKTKLKLVMQN